mgnify:CR=1 FL=1
MLTIVPTPLGNLKDITFRAIEALKSTDFIIAENPIHSGKLLKHFEIQKKEFIQLAQHNEEKNIAMILERLQKENACLVSDAGTPGISDPGFKLIRACVQKNIKVESLPGPVAAITALAASGLPTDKFLFLGFLGKTEHKVITALEEASKIEATAIFYESPERVVKTLGYISKNFPEARAVVARELTKIHEEYIRGSSLEVEKILKNRQTIKGEITIMISFK